jgi:xanthine dehydrogenase YagS FAD-binding subunit
MQPFVYHRAENIASAVASASAGPSEFPAPTSFLAGGTTLLDLMKLDVMRPATVIDINALADPALARIEVDDRGLRLGALVHMADAAEHPEIERNFPVIAQSLRLAASAQLRNMATLGGNVLQRTRCSYFRDVSYPECNKRNPGSGCAAIEGFNRAHAVLGTSDNCIATYPGDFGQALIALDATVNIMGPRGVRTISFAELHREPVHRPDIETKLQPGEMIVSFSVPAGPWTRRSLYLKIRDRESYEFALASAAVALDLREGMVREARIALGGLATVPWRAKSAEAVLVGSGIDDGSKIAAAEAAFAGARAYAHNGFKIELGKRTLMRALGQAAAMEI